MRLLAAAVLVVAIAAGCSGAETAAPTQSPASGSTAPLAGAADDDPTPAPLDWRRCGSGLECATLPVPLDYDDPTNGQVDLSVIRRKASDQDHRIGSLIVNPGGPGGSGVSLVRDGGYGIAEGFDQRFDIVSWDPRGVGESDRLDCGGGAGPFLARDPSPNSPGAQQALDAAAESIADDCAAHAGPILDHIGTDVVIRDLEQLRRAVGDDRLTYAGYSYGTAIGLAYAERYPTRIRAMVLDGVVEPEANLEAMLTEQTQAMDRSLTEMLARCSSTPGCPLPDAGVSFDQLSRRVEGEPIRSTLGRSLGPSDLATAAIQATYGPGFEPTFYQAIDMAEHDNGAGLVALADTYRTSVPGYATYAAVTCTDLPHPVGAADYEAFADRLAVVSPRLGAAIANEMLPCAFWPAPAVGVPHAPRVAGAPTILVVGNTGDAATPYASAVRVAEQVPGSVLVTYEGRGHTSYGRSSCITDLVRSYLVDGERPPDGTVCTADS